MNIQTPINDNTTELPRQPGTGQRPHWNDLFGPVIRAYATARLAELADEHGDDDRDSDLDLRSWALSEAAEAMRDLYDLYMEREGAAR